MSGKPKKKRAADRPLEVKTSRKPVSTFREVFDTKKFSRRDPRFEESSGKFDKLRFDADYCFLKDMRNAEKEELKKCLKKEKDSERKERIEALLKRLDAQEKVEENKIQRREQLKELSEKSGRKTHFNRTQLKKLEIVAKFKELKKTSKLEKYLERKRKKNAAKDRKKLLK